MGGTTFGLNTIVGGTKSLLKGSVQVILIGGAIEALVKGVGWIQDKGVIAEKIPGTVPGTSLVSGGSSMDTSCANKVSGVYSMDDGSGRLIIVDTSPYTSNGFQYINNCGDHYISIGPTGVVDPSKTVDSIKPVAFSVIDSNLINDFMNAQNSDFVKNILKEMCDGSVNSRRSWRETGRKLTYNIHNQ